MANSAASAALLKPVAKRGRNVFPLDNTQTYSIRSGQITPVKVRHFIPGDHFDIDTKDTAVTFPMNTYAFLKARKETSFYSVFYSAVWSLYNQYMATRQDPKSSAFGQVPQLVEPRISLRDLYLCLLPQFTCYLYYKYLIPDFYHEAEKRGLLSFTSYRNGVDEFIKIAQSIFLSGLYPDRDDPYYLSSFFQHINSGDINFTSNLLTPDNNVLTYVGASFVVADHPLFFLGYGSNQVDYIESPVNKYVFDVVGHWRVYSWIRKLDMLGYGNVYPLFNIAERFMSTFEVPSTINIGELHEHFYNHLMTAVRYLYGRLNAATRVDGVDKMVNLYSICAYNSVFYHFFRNSYYDLKYFCNDYSLDFISVAGNQSRNSICVPTDFSPRFLDIEYHQWKKDLFTSVLPDAQFGAVASVSFNNVSIINSYSGGLRSVEVRSNDTGFFDNALSAPVPGATTGSEWNIPSAFDVIQLKRAELLQDYRQTLMRAGNKTSDIFKALYGGSPSSEHEDDVIPRFLETFGAQMNINPVVSTAQTGAENNGNLGDIGARASFSGGQSSLKFNAGNNFGCIICLTYVVPDAQYNSYMLDRHNLELTPEQHFIPQYENYGLESIYSDELNSLFPASTLFSAGFGPRYYHKKSEVDKVHGAFVQVPAGTLGLNNPSLNMGQFIGQDFVGEFNHWISARTDMQNRGATTLSDFYINPAVLDNVFVRAISPDIADDQFLCVTEFDVKSTREMSKVGLINFV